MTLICTLLVVLILPTELLLLSLNVLAMEGNLSVKFHTRFNPPVSPAVVFTDPSMTDQSQKRDCDVNYILAKFRETGTLSDPLHPSNRQPLFGDFTNLPDYQGALDLIAQADDAFMQLPAKVRARFENNPQEIFDFLNDEKNRDEAVKLGLIEAKSAAESQTAAEAS